MATTDKTFITTQGRKMLVDLDNDRAYANGFNIYFSTGDLTGMTDDQIVNLQDIQNKDIKVKADVIHLDQGDTKIRAQATYTGSEKGIYIKTYATYAVDSNNNEMLFAVYLNSEPQYLLSSANGNETTQGYGFNVGISQTDNVNFTKLSNITATLQDVQQMVDGGDAVTLHTNQDVSGDKNFNGKLQKNSVDVATINDVADKLSQFSGDDKDHNFTGKLSYNGSDVATKSYADSTAAKQYDNAVTTAKSYANNISDFFSSNIPLQVQLINNNNASNPSYSAITAYFNVSTMQVTLRGSINYQNNAIIRIDTSSIRKFLNSWLDIISIAINNFNFFIVVPSHIYQDNIDFQITKPGNFSLDGISIQLGLVDKQPIQHININLTNSNASEFTLNNAWGDYTPINQTVTLHGNVIANRSVNDNDTIFSFGITDLIMNKIVAQNMSSQSYIANTDNALQNVVVSSPSSQNSGYTWNLEGSTIQLGYDATLKPRVPTVLNGYQCQFLNNGDDLNNYFTKWSRLIYYKAPGVHVLNSPYPDSAEFIMQVVTDDIGSYENIIRIDSGTNGTPMRRGYNTNGSNILDTTWQPYNYASGGTTVGGVHIYLNAIFKKFGGSAGYMYTDY